MQRYGWLLFGALLPFVMIGILATLSISGAIGGIPLLLVVGRPTRIGLRVALGVQDPTRLSKGERAHLGACVVLLAVAYAVIGASAVDDLDTVQDGIVWAVLAMDLVSVAVATVTLLRIGPTPPLSAERQAP